MVIKKDGTRERFERQKLIGGLLKAVEKRPVSVASLEAVADRVHHTHKTTDCIPLVNGATCR